MSLAQFCALSSSRSASASWRTSPFLSCLKYHHDDRQGWEDGLPQAGGIPQPVLHALGPGRWSPGTSRGVMRGSHTKVKLHIRQAHKELWQKHGAAAVAACCRADPRIKTPNLNVERVSAAGVSSATGRSIFPVHTQNCAKSQAQASH